MSSTHEVTDTLEHSALVADLAVRTIVLGNITWLVGLKSTELVIDKFFLGLVLLLLLGSVRSVVTEAKFAQLVLARTSGQMEETATARDSIEQ